MNIFRKGTILRTGDVESRFLMAILVMISKNKTAGSPFENSGSSTGILPYELFWVIVYGKYLIE